VDVFRASRPRGTLVFIHGGYFRSFSKTEFSFVADGFAGTGLSVALINYPLCPEVSLETLVDSVKRSFAHLLREVLTPAERARIVVAGHSAGGYLTAALVATDWTAHGLPVAPFHGAVPISGVFDLGPLVHTSMNEQIRRTRSTSPVRRRGSPCRWWPLSGPPRARSSAGNPPRWPPPGRRRRCWRWPARTTSPSSTRWRRPAASCRRR
jgi:acetyl esterase/lipase